MFLVFSLNLLYHKIKICSGLQNKDAWRLQGVMIRERILCLIMRELIEIMQLSLCGVRGSFCGWMIVFFAGRFVWMSIRVTRDVMILWMFLVMGMVNRVEVSEEEGVEGEVDFVEGDADSDVVEDEEVVEEGEVFEVVVEVDSEIIVGEVGSGVADVEVAGKARQSTHSFLSHVFCFVYRLHFFSWVFCINKLTLTHQNKRDNIVTNVNTFDELKGDS